MTAGLLVVCVFYCKHVHLKCLLETAHIYQLTCLMYLQLCLLVQQCDVISKSSLLVAESTHPPRDAAGWTSAWNASRPGRFYAGAGLYCRTTIMDATDLCAVYGAVHALVSHADIALINFILYFPLLFTSFSKPDSGPKPKLGRRTALIWMKLRLNFSKICIMNQRDKG